MAHRRTYDIEVYDKKDDWEQGYFLVHGYDDVLWTDDSKQAAIFIQTSIEKARKELNSQSNENKKEGK